jgi:hypothetical protein
MEILMFDWLLRRSQRHEQQDRVSYALANYPAYEPPQWDATKSLSDNNLEYADFFLDRRNRRLEALRSFLINFDVVLSMDNGGIMDVSSWCPIYGDFLVPELETEDVFSAYHDFELPWAGRLIGLNVIFDVGIYVGECILHRNQVLKWQPMRGPESRNICHPIFGENRTVFDPIQSIYVTFRNIVVAKRFPRVHRRSTFMKPDALFHEIQGNILQLS